MNLADITVGFEQVTAIIFLVGWFVRLEARGNTLYKEVEFIKMSNSKSSETIVTLLERMARIESKIDTLINKN